MTGPKGEIAVFWDESFLWAVFVYRALHREGLPFRFVTSQEIRAGALGEIVALLVPGGWASKKIDALGDGGVAAIRQFVKEGGTYIGFCGGAGLATREGIGLVEAKRKPTRNRVPSFSGRIRLDLQDDPLWEGVADPVFHAWWPSQFDVGPEVSVLATYGEALPDAFSSDLNVGDVTAAGGWAELERYYGINLDPRRLLHEPAVIRSAFGAGSVLLSLVHFDSPEDENGRRVLRNLWRLVGAEVSQGRDGTSSNLRTLPLPAGHTSLPQQIRELKAAVDGLIDLGLRNFLWFRRTEFMLHWRRGVRGLEYNTLKTLLDEIAELVGGTKGQEDTAVPEVRPKEAERLAGAIEARAVEVKDVLLPFVEEASKLLLLERQAMLRERLTYEETTDSHIRAMRERLFSTSKSHGGLFKEVIDRLDALLFSLLTFR